MKKALTISGITLVCFGMLASFVFFRNNSNAVRSYRDKDEAKEAQNERTEEQSIKYYADWMNSMMANPATGRVDMSDVLQAREQLAAYHSKHSRGGSLLNLGWETMGPNNVGGRTRAILIDKNNPDHMYAGGVSGGIFYSLNGGLQWYPHPANVTLGSVLISSIAQAANGDIYIGTGESWLSWFDGSGSYSHAFTGNGIYKCTNVGDPTTEVYTLLTATEPTPGTIGSLPSAPWGYINRIACHPTNSDIVMAATNSGLKYSSDGGATWANATTAAGSSMLAGCGEVQFDADGYAHALYIGAKYYRSVDNITPSILDIFGAGIPSTSWGRGVIGLTSSNSNYVYLYTSTTGGDFGGVFRSTDRGANFTSIGPGASSSFFNPLGGQGEYNLCMAVNPANPDRIYIGGQLQAWTWDGATGNWTAMTDAGYPTYYVKYIHADHHFMYFNPTNPNVMYVGCDGGISRTVNAEAAYPDFSVINKGYDVTQAHGVGVGFYGEPIGGNQDNGTEYVNFLGSSPLQAIEVVGGDGGKAEASKIRPEYLFGTFASFPGGSVNGSNLRRSVNAGTSSSSIFDCHIDKAGGSAGTACDPDGAADNGGEFVTPFVLWENYDLYHTFETVLTDVATVEYPAGSGTFYNYGDVVNYNGRDITLTRTGISESHLFLAALGNLWMTTGALFNSTEAPTWFKLASSTTVPAVSGVVSTFEYDNTGDILYFGTSTGRLYRLSGLLTADFQYSETDTWDPITAGITSFEYPQIFPGRITGISIDRDNPDNLVLSTSGYGVDNNVQHTNNALSDSSAIFTSISSSGKLPDIPIFDVLMIGSDPDKILAAGEYGVWSYSISSGADWTQEVGAADPNTTDEYEILPLGNTPVFEVREAWVRETDCKAIYLGSHGRGFWRSLTLSDGGCDFTKHNDLVSAPIQEEIIAGIGPAPNPADTYCDVAVTLTHGATMSVKVYNMSGTLITNLGSALYATGTTHINLNVASYAAGNYLIVFDIGGSLVSKKIAVI